MNTALTLRPLADQHMDDIRREAIKAIRECLDPLALTGRILRYTDPDERLRFIRAARAYYQQQIDDCKEAGVSHCIDTLVPRLGDLTDYFKSHEKQAEAELRQRAGSDSPYGEPAARPAQKPTPKQTTKQTTTNTPIHMTFYNYGSAQVFESGSNPTINIEQFGAPEQMNLQQVEEETTKDGGNSFDHESSPICTNEAEAGECTTTRPEGAKATEQQARRFLYFSREATDKDKQEFEQQLTDAAPRGNRYVVDLFNSYSYYLDLRGIRTTDLHREMQQWGLTSRYDAFQKAMLKCRCIR